MGIELATAWQETNMERFKNWVVWVRNKRLLIDASHKMTAKMLEMYDYPDEMYLLIFVRYTKTVEWTDNLLNRFGKHFLGSLIQAGTPTNKAKEIYVKSLIALLTHQNWVKNDSANQTSIRKNTIERLQLSLGEAWLPSGPLKLAMELES